MANSLMTSVMARERARHAREEAMKQASFTLRYHMQETAAQFDLLAAELDRLERAGG
ncbi:MAG TPA: hypothetical protein VMH36_11720 [Alphaproteobacteria bacterium]|nr:hypothetical protein [Alphaproteobacteria bacterium]